MFNSTNDTQARKISSLRFHLFTFSYIEINCFQRPHCVPLSTPLYLKFKVYANLWRIFPNILFKINVPCDFRNNFAVKVEHSFFLFVDPMPPLYPIKMWFTDGKKFLLENFFSSWVYLLPGCSSIFLANGIEKVRQRSNLKIRIENRSFMLDLPLWVFNGFFQWLNYSIEANISNVVFWKILFT